MKDSRIELNGGRELAFTEIGPADGTCLFFFHGAPMSRLHLAGLEQELAARRLRVLSPDRPGYGGSSPRPGRSLSDWPGDVAALADALGIERFLVGAHSSGGPYAVACAALLPQRVRAGVILGGVTDMGWAGAWEGYPEEEIPILRQPDEAAAIAWCTEHYGADGSGFLEGDSLPFPDPDLAVLAEESFGAAVVEAFRQGVGGYAQDLHVQSRPWPFDPGCIGVPFVVVHGEQDDLIPVAHSQHTAELIPHASFRLLPGHGHLSIVAELPGIAAELDAADRSA
ncbi:MAG: alpha/beta hydrolase [Acidobacteria bacterium]|nr:MAG: alpha/beta hydrolase [Acidobacteriota bacterium]REK08534.1 MAG: alpha/beta hydrolase [Acidobacteriota bacterium]